jgi:hypothetical protein
MSQLAKSELLEGWYFTTQPTNQDLALAVVAFLRDRTGPYILYGDGHDGKDGDISFFYENSSGEIEPKTIEIQPSNISTATDLKTLTIGGANILDLLPEKAIDMFYQILLAEVDTDQMQDRMISLGNLLAEYS